MSLCPAIHSCRWQAAASVRQLRFTWSQTCSSQPRHSPSIPPVRAPSIASSCRRSFHDSAQVPEPLSDTARDASTCDFTHDLGMQLSALLSADRLQDAVRMHQSLSPAWLARGLSIHIPLPQTYGLPTLDRYRRFFQAVAQSVPLRLDALASLQAHENDIVAALGRGEPLRAHEIYGVLKSSGLEPTFFILKRLLSSTSPWDSRIHAEFAADSWRHLSADSLQSLIQLLVKNKNAEALYFFATASNAEWTWVRPSLLADAAVLLASNGFNDAFQSLLAPQTAWCVSRASKVSLVRTVYFSIWQAFLSASSPTDHSTISDSAFIANVDFLADQLATQYPELTTEFFELAIKSCLQHKSVLAVQVYSRMDSKYGLHSLGALHRIATRLHPWARSSHLQNPLSLIDGCLFFLRVASQNLHSDISISSKSLGTEATAKQALRKLILLILQHGDVDIIQQVLDRLQHYEHESTTLADGSSNIQPYFASLLKWALHLQLHAPETWQRVVQDRLLRHVEPGSLWGQQKLESLLKTVPAQPRELLYLLLGFAVASRNLPSAQRVLGEAVSRNCSIPRELFVPLLAALAQRGDVDAVTSTMAALHDHGAALDGSTHSQLVKACINNGELARAFKILTDPKAPFSALVDVHGFNELLNAYASEGNFAACTHLLEHMRASPERAPNEATFANLLRACNTLDDIETVQDMGTVLWASNQRPTVVFWNHIMDSYRRIGRPDLAETTLRQIMAPAIPDLVSYNTLMTAWCEENAYYRAKKIFREITQPSRHPNQGPDMQTFNILVGGALKSTEVLDLHKELKFLERQISKWGISPRHQNDLQIMYRLRVLACSNAREALEVVAAMRAQRHTPSSHVHTAVLTVCRLAGDTDTAKDYMLALRAGRDRHYMNAYIYQAYIACLAQVGDMDAIAECLSWMDEADMAALVSLQELMTIAMVMSGALDEACSNAGRSIRCWGIILNHHINTGNDVAFLGALARIPAWFEPNLWDESCLVAILMKFCLRFQRLDEAQRLWEYVVGGQTSGDHALAAITSVSPDKIGFSNLGPNESLMCLYIDLHRYLSNGCQRLDELWAQVTTSGFRFIDSHHRPKAHSTTGIEWPTDNMYTSRIECLCHLGRHHEAFELFVRMVRHQEARLPSQKTFRRLLGLLRSAGQSQYVRRLHDLVDSTNLPFKFTLYI
ncbi:uncharacterized protein BJ171DRAFT_493753 [Polychytrium aggregatum]|uniref:uncharacterized protein n=1 Tax=Polychytrium aggregatum TaxID=110093 RepID=UPI0022FEA1C9|nr:uncharacterized protein BJ171DRAFT_493753 [Polychytrium aggregatum]KAI9207137.1 hypothetical protein BJ171DRAFT_493753 [Polychytrium aggregatum]